MKESTRRKLRNRHNDDGAMVQSLVRYQSTQLTNDDIEDSYRSSLRTYWDAFRRNVGLVIGITLIATVAVAIYEFRQPDQYEAQARLEIGRETSAPGVKNLADSTAGADESVYFNTQLQILTSQALLRRVVKTLDLEHDDAFLHPNQALLHSPWQKLLRQGRTTTNPDASNAKDLPVTPEVATVATQDDLADAKKLEPFVAALERGLRVDPIRETRTDVKETRLVDISFDHNVPQIAAKVVNAVADASVRMNMERKLETGEFAGQFLQKRITELQGQIRGREEDLLSYAQKNQIISLDASAGANTVVERLAGLNRELLDAENERHKAEAAYKAASAPNGAEAMALETMNQNNADESKLAELKQRRVLLLVENTEEWPEVKEIDKQIVEVERQIQDRRQNAAANIRTILETRYRQAMTREQSLRDTFNQQQSATIAQNQAAVNYKIMQQEIETDKGILQSLLQHSKENDIAQAGVSNSIHVIDHATVPDRPIGPRRALNVGLALLFSMGLAMAWVLIRDRFDDSLRSMSDVERKLNVPALAIVPPIKSRPALLPSVGPFALIGGRRVAEHPELLLGSHNPVIAEVYHQLRTSLLLSRNGLALKSLLVTSSLPSEGKTTTAINTAVSLAESGANVLLVDADLRRPSLHRILEVDNNGGLSNALSNGMDSSEILSFIKKTEVSRLSLLPSGPRLMDSAKLLDHQKLHNLLVTLESNYTHIVIDSPPIVPFADSVILGAEVDGVLMVIQGGQTPKELVLRSMKLLDDVDAVIIGVLLNNTRLQPLDTYYQSYCQQYYQTPETKVVPDHLDLS